MVDRLQQSVIPRVQHSHTIYHTENTVFWYSNLSYREYMLQYNTYCSNPSYVFSIYQQNVFSVCNLSYVFSVYQQSIIKILCLLYVFPVAIDHIYSLYIICILCSSNLSYIFSVYKYIIYVFSVAAIYHIYSLYIIWILCSNLSTIYR